MNPILVEVMRGGVIESCHRGSFAVVDTAGTIAAAAGDIAASVYPRSAVKPLQALPLVASGAADRLGLEPPEIALACGSHGGEALHVAAASSMLRKAGRDPSCLACGAHRPLDEAAARALDMRGEEPSALHNNCSGKHAGFVCLACSRGIDPSRYARPGHPVMQEVTATLAVVTGARLAGIAPGIDGCSIPTLPVPIAALARGFARFGSGNRLPDSLATAAKRIRTAIAGHPLMIAGSGRFDTRIAATCGEAMLVKSGAEGVACAAIPSQGLGIAVKIDDGAGRAAQIVMAALLLRFAESLPGFEMTGISPLVEFAEPAVQAWNGDPVGRMRPTPAVTGPGTIP